MPGRPRPVPLILVTALAMAGAVFAATPPASGATPIAGPLHTSGSQILDGHDRPVRLRGVVSGWLSTQPTIWSQPDTPLDPRNLAAMPRWGTNSTGAGGVNVVRVMLGEQFWEPDQCEYVAGYQATVSSVVDQITREGMVALLVLRADTRLPCAGPAGQQDMADPEALSFWTSVASAFASNPLVAFELYNEPHLYNDVASPLEAQGADSAAGDDWDLWLHGGVSIDGGVPAPVVGMQQMYDVVRATGAQNLVLVDGNSWAEDPPPTDHLVRGTNVVYAQHVYNCINVPCAPGADSLPASVNRWPSFYSSRPTMITEFGYPSSNDGAFDQNVIGWAEAHGVGWAAFAWDQAAAGGFGLLQGLTGDTPTTAGVPVQQGVGLNS